ncbi:MAG: SMP-30/gluconolactonase/LRE family protein [Acidimicrobiales bacterium]
MPTEDGRLVVCLDDGLHLHDPDTATTELLVAYPEGLGERANDACADLAGNLVTGTLKLVEAPGSAWWFSATEGWRLLDDDIANTNGLRTRRHAHPRRGRHVEATRVRFAARP